MSLFKEQSLFSIICETNYSGLASASVTKILYTKPGGETGFWTATVSGTKLVYNVSNGDIDKDGIWKFQAYAEIGGLKAYGDIDQHHFEKPLV